MLQQTKTRVHTLFKQRLVRFLVLPLLAVVLLVYSYAGLREWAKRHADQLQVTVVQLSPDPGHSPVIYQHTFGRALAAFAENVLNNGMTGEDGPPSVSSTLNGDPVIWIYYLTFRWHGFTVEATGTGTDGFPEVYAVSALGTTDHRLAISKGAQYSFILRLSTESGGAIPIPPGSSLGPA